jgi:hypothetical protein
MLTVEIPITARRITLKLMFENDELAREFGKLNL